MARPKPFNDGDSWLTNLYACEAVGREAMEKISQRNMHHRNSTGYVQANAKARQLMKTFAEGKDMLMRKLSDSRLLLNEGEYERRERLLDALQTKKIQIDAAFSQQAETENRNLLISGAGSSATGGAFNEWGVAETDETRDLTFDELQQQKQLAIQEQDKGLDQLHDIVVRQKFMAQNIGQELELHNEIIEDVIDNADRTRERLIKETRNVVVVDRKSNTCGYWITIILLLIAIVAVACIPKS